MAQTTSHPPNHIQQWGVTPEHGAEGDTNCTNHAKTSLAVSAGKDSQGTTVGDSPFDDYLQCGRHSSGWLRGNDQAPANQFRPTGEKWKRDTRGTHLAVLLEGSGQRGGLSILLEPTCAWWWMEVALAGGARVGVGGRCSNSLVCLVTSLFCYGSLPEAGILTAFKCLLCACTIVIGLVLSLKGEGGRRGGSALVCLGGSSGAQRAEGLRNTPERRVPQLLPQSLALSWRVCRKRNKREAELGRAL